MTSSDSDPLPMPPAMNERSDAAVPLPLAYGGGGDPPLAYDAASSSQLNYAGSATQLPTNGMAIAGLVLGIVSLFFCAWYVAFPSGILAIVFGSISRTRIKRGQSQGAGLALSGLILGCVGTALHLIIVGIIIVFITRSAPRTAKPVIPTPSNAAKPPATLTGSPHSL